MLTLGFKFSNLVYFDKHLFFWVDHRSILLIEVVKGS